MSWDGGGNKRSSIQTTTTTIVVTYRSHRRLYFLPASQSVPWLQLSEYLGLAVTRRVRPLEKLNRRFYVTRMISSTTCWSVNLLPRCFVLSIKSLEDEKLKNKAKFVIRGYPDKKHLLVRTSTTLQLQSIRFEFFWGRMAPVHFQMDSKLTAMRRKASYITETGIFGNWSVFLQPLSPWVSFYGHEFRLSVLQQSCLHVWNQPCTSYRREVL